jgi:Ser/Thr protein kinase RdoA (MazF antagonist)
LKRALTPFRYHARVSDETPYAELSPERILAAVESVGITCTGSILALNSYENRVYQLGTEGGFVVAKFYRPGRWSDEAILEEHAFSRELAEHEIPVVAPLELAGKTLNAHEGYRFAVFERRGGRWPELGSSSERQWMGRFLGRIHAVGSVRRFAHRPKLSIERLGEAPVEELLASDWIPAHLVGGYESITTDLLEAIRRRFDEVADIAYLRIHGDCHPGNVLWTDDGPHFVDLDDCMNGPAVQDLWLFLSGGRDEMTGQLADLLEGYAQFARFDPRELHLIESLRTLRMLHYAAWIARRWADPAFPRAFPWFAENKYWEEHVLALREQRAALDEPPLPS